MSQQTRGKTNNALWSYCSNFEWPGKTATWGLAEKLNKQLSNASERARPKMQRVAISANSSGRHSWKYAGSPARTLVNSGTPRNGNHYLQYPLRWIWICGIYVEERLEGIFAEKHSQFPRELIKCVLYFDKDDFLFSMVKVVFLRSFPVQNVQGKSISLAMVEVKRNNT